MKAILALLVATAVLAGCASNDNNTNTSSTPVSTTTTSSTPASSTPASSTPVSSTPVSSTPSSPTPTGTPQQQAETLLAQAAQQPANSFAITWTATNGTTLATGKFVNDTAHQTMLFTLDLRVADPEASLAAGEITFYTTPAGTVWLLNGTAYALAPQQSEAFGQSAPQPEKIGGSFEESPFANGTVTSVTSTTYKGLAAYDVAGTDEHGAPIHVVLYKNPTRFAYIEGRADAESTMDMPQLANSTMRLEFLETSVAPTPSTTVTRAMGLVHDSTATMGTLNGTWTFRANGSLPVSDVRLVILAPSEESMSGAGMPDPRTSTPVWNVTLASLPHSEGGVSATFSDNDHDGKVSYGDTLTLTQSDQGQYIAALYDPQTGTFVVPGFGLLAGLGVLVLAAIALRRRG